MHDQSQTPVLDIFPPSWSNLQSASSQPPHAPDRVAFEPSLGSWPNYTRARSRGNLSHCFFLLFLRPCRLPRRPSDHASSLARSPHAGRCPTRIRSVRRTPSRFRALSAQASGANPQRDHVQPWHCTDQRSARTPGGRGGAAPPTRVTADRRLRILTSLPSPTTAPPRHGRGPHRLPVPQKAGSGRPRAVPEADSAEKVHEMRRARQAPRGARSRCGRRRIGTASACATRFRTPCQCRLKAAHFCQPKIAHFRKVARRLAGDVAACAAVVPLP